MAYSSKGPIPLFKDQQQQQQTHFSRPCDELDDNRPSGSPKVPIFANNRREKSGRGAGRPNVKPSGMNDPYDFDIAPLNILENSI